MALDLAKNSCRRQASAFVVAVVFSVFATASQAGDIFIGGYEHGLSAPPQSEHGQDIMLGYRTASLRGWMWLARPSVDVFISANSATSTDFVVVGLNWPLAVAYDGRLYIRPGLGLAYSTGEANIGAAFDPEVSQAERQRRLHLSQTRIDFGSHVLFSPELALGYKLTPRIAVETSYVHLSNGQIFHHGKNQGLDDVGVRMAYSF